jgi:hypothetical protein
MELLLEIEKINTKSDLDSESYYSSLSKFSDELSAKIGISNVFDRKISILRDSNVLSMQEIFEKYPEYNQIRNKKNRILHKKKKKSANKK